MVELDDAMRRALLAREGPPAGARAEILAGLRARLGGPSDPGSGEPTSGDPGSLAGSASAGARAAWAAKVAAATVGLTASGLLTLKLGALALGGLGEAPRERPEAPSERAEQPAEPRERSEVSPSRPPPKVDVPARPSPAIAASEPAPASEGESSLAAELALVRAAKQARVDDREAALAKLDDHRRRFATGMLAPEREALRIELLCELGRKGEAEAARERFLAEFAGSPLRSRVLASCSNAGTDSIDAGD